MRWKADEFITQAQKRELTQEEIAAEKLRQQKLQEDADFELAKGLVGEWDYLALRQVLLGLFSLGTNEELRGDSIDTMTPSSKEDFNQFQELITKKISQFNVSYTNPEIPPLIIFILMLQSSAHYVNFLENTFRDLCLSCESEDIKRLASNLNALANEKTKLQKVKLSIFCC